jgi:hypothetical protein
MGLTFYWTNIFSTWLINLCTRTITLPMDPFPRLLIPLKPSFNSIISMRYRHQQLFNSCNFLTNQSFKDWNFDHIICTPKCFSLNIVKKSHYKTKNRKQYVNLSSLIIDFLEVENKFHTPKTLATHYTICTNLVMTYLKGVQVFIFTKP